MGEYRAYTVDFDGHIIGFVPPKCANDAEAIEKAKQPERSQAAVPPNGQLKLQEKSYAHH
jgi:hypothetical protein